MNPSSTTHKFHNQSTNTSVQYITGKNKNKLNCTHKHFTSIDHKEDKNKLIIYVKRIMINTNEHVIKNYICKIKRKICDIIIIPRKGSSALAFIFFGSTDLTVGFQVRQHRIPLVTPGAAEVFLTMFSSKMLLYASQVSKSPCWIMVGTTNFWADVHLLLHGLLIRLFL